jgi:hypothetical protein
MACCVARGTELARAGEAAARAESRPEVAAVIGCGTRRVLPQARNGPRHIVFGHALSTRILEVRSAPDLGDTVKYIREDRTEGSLRMIDATFREWARTLRKGDRVAVTSEEEAMIAAPEEVGPA